MKTLFNRVTLFTIALLFLSCFNNDDEEEMDDDTKIIELSGDMAFGDVAVGVTANKTFTISNTGNTTLTISGITYPTEYTGNWNTGIIAINASQEVTVTFSPTAEQDYNGTITVNSDKTSGINTLAISGTGTITQNDLELVTVTGGTIRGLGSIQ